MSSSSFGKTQVATFAGECDVFYNDVAKDPEVDPYLERVGWYFQAAGFDDAPQGPFDSRSDAEVGAVDHYGAPVIAAP